MYHYKVLSVYMHMRMYDNICECTDCFHIILHIFCAFYL
jgi:hypothetical protein